jgi:hypothetical protein
VLYGAPAFIMLVLLAALYWGTGSSSTNAAFTLRPSALRGTSDGASMTTPGGAGTPPKHCNLLRVRRTGFSHRVGASTSQATALALPRSCALKTLQWTLTTFKGEGVMVRLASEGLRSVGATSPSKSVCSILPIARHLRAGELFSASTPARGSLLKPAVDQ